MVLLISFVKIGYEAEKNQDYIGFDPDTYTAIVSDGAGEAMYSGIWSRLIVEAGMEDPANALLLDKWDWLDSAMENWMGHAASRFQSMNFWQQEKIKTGSAATFLIINLVKNPDDTISWKASAVGDSNLFIFRNGRLTESFPMKDPSEFNVTPPLVYIVPNSDLSDVEFHGCIMETDILHMEGTARPGDVFLYGTDAVSLKLLSIVKEEGENALSNVLGWDADAWREAVMNWREEGSIQDDDSTLGIFTVPSTDEFNLLQGNTGKVNILYPVSLVANPPNYVEPKPYVPKNPVLPGPDDAVVQSETKPDESPGGTAHEEAEKLSCFPVESGAEPASSEAENGDSTSEDIGDERLGQESGNSESGEIGDIPPGPEPVKPEKSEEFEGNKPENTSN